MKRHESLAPLSREHHDGLILAQLLKKGAPAYRGLPTDLAGKLSYARDLYESLLEAHFLLEEKVLELVGGRHPDIDSLAGEIRNEHRSLSRKFHALSYTDSSLEGKLDELGHELENHIRKEERLLFPVMQEQCTAVDLEAIGHLIENARYEKGHQEQE